jgi:hypothetical protein
VEAFVSVTASLADNPIAGINTSIAMMTKVGLNAATRSLVIARRYPRERGSAWSSRDAAAQD